MQKLSCPCPRYEGVVAVYLHSFLTSALNGGECSIPYCGFLTPTNSPGIH